MKNILLFSFFTMMALTGYAQTEKRVKSIKEYYTNNPDNYQFDLFTYDDAGRIAKEDITVTNEYYQETAVKEYVYDLDNNRIRLILQRYREGEPEGQAKEAYYTLEGGRVVETDFSYLGVEDMGNYVATFTYDEKGRPITFEEKNKDITVQDFYYFDKYTWIDNDVIWEREQRVYDEVYNSSLRIPSTNIKGQGILKYWPFIGAGWVLLTPFGYWPFLNLRLDYMPGLLHQYEVDDYGNIVKIVYYNTIAYEIGWEEVDGINAVYTTSEKSANNCYSLSGLRLKIPQKGINIVNGRKVVVK